MLQKITTPNKTYVFDEKVQHLEGTVMLWARILIRGSCTTLCDNICQWLATGLWLSTGPPVSSTNKTDRHDITEIFLKVALNTIKQTNINNCISGYWKPVFFLRMYKNCGIDLQAHGIDFYPALILFEQANYIEFQ